MKLQDYIHYYKGCRCLLAPYGGQPNRLEEGVITGIQFETVYVKFDKWQSIASGDTSSIKLILRKLEDMNDDDIKSFIEWDHLSVVYKNVTFKKYLHCIGIHYDVDMDDEGLMPQSHSIHFSRLSQLQFHHLLKAGFDIFNLIKNGLAIDAKTLK